MQKLKFVRRTHGISSKSNKPYDMTEVSDGLASFTLSNDIGIGTDIENLELSLGDDFYAEVHVSVAYGSLRGTIVKVSSVDL